ncbi:MAG: YoaK family protein [Acetobacteraceae bacterium]
MQIRVCRFDSGPDLQTRPARRAPSALIAHPARKRHTAPLTPPRGSDSLSDAEPTIQAPVGFGLLWLLAALAGAVDARGIALLHDVFLSFMSGNSTMLAVSLARAEWPHVQVIGTVIGVFVAGAAIGQVVADLSGRWRLPVVVALVTILLALPLVTQSVAVLALTFAMGALNAGMAHAGAVTVSITFVTGALVRFGQGLGALLLGRTGGWAWLAHMVPWTGLMAGAVLATLASRHYAATLDAALLFLSGVLTALTTVAVRRAG